MKHPLTKTIENLEWLQNQDLIDEMWESLVPLLDKLNIRIEMYRMLDQEAKEKVSD